MDPDACVDRINGLIEDNDPLECIFACDDLLEWLGKGGFVHKTAIDMSKIPDDWKQHSSLMWKLNRLEDRRIEAAL